METTLNLTLNLASQLQHKTVGGRRFYVAPVTLIVPGVLAGSKGPLYYPPEEVSANVARWNGVPLVLNHPVENGKHISARSPGVIDNSGMGYLYNVRYENDKLVGDAWFDIEATRRVSFETLQALESKQRIEVSTGLYTQNEDTAGSTPTGQTYNQIARSYEPDHLAILMSTTGACSIKDGCGVFNERGDLVPLTTEQRKEMVDDLVSNCSCWEEGDRGSLEKLDDAQLQKVHNMSTEKREQEQIANAALEGFDDQQGNNHVFNEETGKWESKFKAPKKPAKPKAKPKAKPVVNEEDDDEDNDDETSSLSQEDQAILNWAKNKQQEEKEKLAEKIVTSNTKLSDKDRKKAKSALLSRDIGDLEFMANMIPEEEVETPTKKKRDYSASSLPSSLSFLNNQTADDDDDDDADDVGLPLPTINWAEEAAQN